MGKKILFFLIEFHSFFNAILGRFYSNFVLKETEIRSGTTEIVYEKNYTKDL